MDFAGFCHKDNKLSGKGVTSDTFSKNTVRYVPKYTLNVKNRTLSLIVTANLQKTTTFVSEKQ